jgi:hypothetical protein
MPKNIIVSTTIHPPTQALKSFAQKEDWTLLVVGDINTPHAEYQEMPCIYYHPDEQALDYPRLSELIGWRTIQRRNLGFLKALSMGAEIVASVDDDNVPFESWGKEIFVGKTIEIPVYETSLVFDPLSITNYPQLWHRGFPIQFLRERISKSHLEFIEIDIQADFWNGDPDIDAICRMEHMPDCKFQDDPFPFSSNVFSPFNSQNTFLSRRALKNYFMFPGVGRMDDIWASYYLESLGFRVLYSKASVEQVRNPHDLTVDFMAEILGYTQTYKLLEELKLSAASIRKFLPEDSILAFEEYLRIAKQY